MYLFFKFLANCGVVKSLSRQEKRLLLAGHNVHILLCTRGSCLVQFLELEKISTNAKLLIRNFTCMTFIPIALNVVLVETVLVGDPLYGHTLKFQECMPTSYIPQLVIELFFESLFTNFFLLCDFWSFLGFHGTNIDLLLKSRLFLIPLSFVCMYCLRLEVWKMASLFDKIFSLATSAPKQGYEILSWMETTNFLLNFLFLFWQKHKGHSITTWTRRGGR